MVGLKKYNTDIELLSGVSQQKLLSGVSQQKYRVIKRSKAQTHNQVQIRFKKSEFWYIFLHPYFTLIL
jgi:hypothetical protein